ncbi:hypothetical protein LINGRAHAP2_LOCUS24503 [Linum grandiflorum]
MSTIRLYCESIICERWNKLKLQLYKDYFEELKEKTEVEKKAEPPQGVALHDWTKLVEHMNTLETMINFHKYSSFIRFHSNTCLNLLIDLL